jgi:hypothetical protein
MGRNKIEDRSLIKSTLKVYVEQFKIDKIGGKDSAKKFLIDAINDKYLNEIKKDGKG